MKTIDILLRGDTVENLLRGAFSHAGGQRILYEDPVNPIVGIKPGDKCKELVERCGGRKPMYVNGYARLGCCFFLVPDVNRGGGVVAGENEREAWRSACRRGKRRDGRFEFFTDGRGQRGAIQPTRGGRP